MTTVTNFVNSFVAVKAAGFNRSPNALERSSVELLKFLNTCVGSFSNNAFKESAPSSSTFFNALITTSLVNLPSDANFLSSPIVTPSSAAIGARIVGTCSAILLISSPCCRPEPRACANCLKAF